MITDQRSNIPVVHFGDPACLRVHSNSNLCGEWCTESGSYTSNSLSGSCSWIGFGRGFVPGWPASVQTERYPVIRVIGISGSRRNWWSRSSLRSGACQGWHWVGVVRLKADFPGEDIEWSAAEIVIQQLVADSVRFTSSSYSLQRVYSRANERANERTSQLGVSLLTGCLQDRITTDHDRVDSLTKLWQDIRFGIYWLQRIGLSFQTTRKIYPLH